jgi:DNA-binding response OmpR family regulator
MSPQRILVVEHEMMVAEVVDRYLRRDGYDVSVIHDGADALPEFDRFAPDPVVLHLPMATR